MQQAFVGPKHCANEQANQVHCPGTAAVVVTQTGQELACMVVNCTAIAATKVSASSQAVWFMFVVFVM